MLDLQKVTASLGAVIDGVVSCCKAVFVTERQVFG